MDNVEILKGLFDNFNTRNIEGCLAVLSDDFVLEDMPSEQIYRGKEGFLAWVGPFAEASPDTSANLTHIIAQGDWISAEHIGGGNHTGTFKIAGGDIPPTGRKFYIKFCEVFQFRDGKIVYMRAYYDTANLLRQLGALPALTQSEA